MKITKELKFVMQLNSFLGIVASTVLIKMGVHTSLAYTALVVNGLSLLNWVFIKENAE